MLEPGREYKSFELPGDVFNRSNGDIVSSGGQQYKITVNGNGTRSFTPMSGASGSGDPMDLVRQAQQYQVEQNQPAIQTLTAQKGTLDDQYKKILDDISTQFQPVENSAVTTTNNELGKRGITGDSTLAQQQINGALIPIEGQKAGVRQASEQNQINDMNSITNQIASLQAGNVGNALTFGQGVNATQAALQASLAQSQAQIDAQKIANQKPFSVDSGAGVFNPSTNSFSTNSPTSLAALSSRVNNKTSPIITSPGSYPTTSLSQHVTASPAVTNFKVSGSSNNQGNSDSSYLKLGGLNLSGFTFK